MFNTVRIVAEVILLVLLLAFISYLSITKANLEAKVTDDASYIANLQNANTNCQQDVSKSNTSIKLIESETAFRSKAAIADLGAASRAASAIDAKASAISSQKPSGDDCSSIKKLVDGYFK